MVKIFYCPSCGFVGADEESNKTMCPKCSKEMVLTNCTHEEWLAYSPEQQEEAKKNFAKNGETGQMDDIEERRNAFIMTTTSTLDGYRIKKYIDVIICNKLATYGPDETIFMKGDAVMNDIGEMKEAALKMGANAVIGMKITFASPGRQNNYYPCVIGTAVLAEKIES